MDSAASPEEGIASQPVRVLMKIAVCDARYPEHPVKPPAWVEEHTHAATAIFARYGILLTFEQELFFPERCDLEGAEQRNTMAYHVNRNGWVTVLVVARVPDLQMMDYELRGVHWRYAGSDSRYMGTRWIFLTVRAEPPVLAHELGHYFGLPHDPAGGNLMTPGPSSPRGKNQKPFAPVLTAAQATRLRSGVLKFLKTWRNDLK